MTTLFTITLAGTIAYLLGSVSPAFFAGRAKGMDLRFEGEETLDFLNAGLVLGRSVGVMVFVADFLKGQIAVGLAFFIGGSPWAIVIAGMLVLAGQIWPLFHDFTGGRGTAVAAGVLIAASPWTLVITATLLALLISITGRLIHAEILTIALLPGIVILTEKADLALMCLIIPMAIMLIVPRWLEVQILLGMRKPLEEEEKDLLELEEEMEKESGGSENPPL